MRVRKHFYLHGLIYFCLHVLVYQVARRSVDVGLANDLAFLKLFFVVVDLLRLLSGRSEVNLQGVLFFCLTAELVLDICAVTAV